MTVDEEILKDFLAESRENLDCLDVDLVALEERPTDAGVLARIFRTIHTIKGTCGFLGFGKLERVAHVGESLLDQLRNHQLGFNAAIATALLTMVDAIRAILGAIESTGGEGDGDYRLIVDQLTALCAPVAPEPDHEIMAPPAPPIAAAVPVAGPAAPDSARSPAAMLPTASTPSPGSGGVAGASSGNQPARDAEARGAPAATAAAPTSDGYVRVDVGLLDRLSRSVQTVSAATEKMTASIRRDHGRGHQHHHGPAVAELRGDQEGGQGDHLDRRADQPAGPERRTSGAPLRRDARCSAARRRVSCPGSR